MGQKKMISETLGNLGRVICPRNQLLTTVYNSILE